MNTSSLLLSRPLSEAFFAMHEELGTKPVEPPTESRSWQYQAGIVRWSHSLFGDLQFKVFSQFSHMGQEGAYTWARLDLQGEQPRDIQVGMKASNLDEGLQILHFKNDTMIRIDSCGVKGEIKLPRLEVPIYWKKTPQGPRAQTSKKDSKFEKNDDEITLILLRPDGLFMHLEVSVTSRNGEYLFFCVQELAMAQVGITTQAILDKLGLQGYQYGNKRAIVVPARTIDAYDGFNWLKTYKMVRDRFIRFALQWDPPYASRLGRCVVAIPQYPELSRITSNLFSCGFEPASVLWFNNSWGGGVVRLDDDRKIFVHFKAIVDAKLAPLYMNGQFAVLQPGAVVAVKYQPSASDSEHSMAGKATEVIVL